ncbi:general transcription factor 3C polypeptide 5-like [Antedon mediterranea]|uniref:general transcription factor 3C polypeptide 5-like n=1 Tax=Antedon mediterranea TaxID=105859 RepID=UPI003AF45DBD
MKREMLTNKTIGVGLVCVEFPGKVENVHNLMECFKGQETLSMVLADKNKKLSLYFRPNDPYSHCCTGEVVPTERILLKVYHRRLKKGSNTSNERGVKDDIKTEIIGVIETSYKFKSFVDFQYLPMTKSSSNTCESILDKIVPSKLEDSSYFKRDVPLFLLPEVFSRTDVSCDYNYKQEKQVQRIKSKILHEAHLVGTDRDRRNNNAIFLKFEDKGIPIEPMPAAVEVLKRYKLNDDVNMVKKLFEERPIWSRTSLMGIANLEFKNIKVVLPTIAYYFVTGPWRALWCKIGYDPRKDPKAKIYQMLDVRIRLSARTYNSDIAFKAAAENNSTKLPRSLFSSRRYNHTCRLSKLPENHHIFKRDILPPFHQMYYQVCDLKDDELQKFVHANDGYEQSCDERDGWLLPDTFQKMRDLIHTLITLKIQEISDKETQEIERNEDEDGEGDEDEEGDEEIDDEMVNEIMEYFQPTLQNT